MAVSESAEFGDYAWAFMLGAGHMDCAGWVNDGGGHRITCTCGIVLYREPATTADMAVLAAIEGHQTYALTAPGDTGWMAVDEFAQCKCQPCVIARASHIGFAECMRQRDEFYKSVAARRDEYDRHRYAVMFAGEDGVPF
jgi:hypothetical protein